MQDFFEIASLLSFFFDALRHFAGRLDTTSLPVSKEIAGRNKNRERKEFFFLHFICLMPISFRHWASFPLANDALTKRVTLTRSRERDLRRIFEWQRVAESAARWLATSRLLPLSSTQQPAIQLEGVEARAFVDCALVFFPQKEFVLSSVHTDCEIDTNEIDQFLRLLLQKT